MGKLPKRPCPYCGLPGSYYPGTNMQVRHIAELRNPGDTPGWCNGTGQLGSEGVPPINPIPVNPVDPEWFNETRGGSAIPWVPQATKWIEVSDRGELADWWRALAESDIAKTLPKAQDYSAYDLELIGRSTVEMFTAAAEHLPWERTGTDPAVYAEIGCWWYLLGKIGRAIGAIREGRLPSDDTCADARIYATMIARIRWAGAWPGSEPN